jgi:dienelactone hydrolase
MSDDHYVFTADDVYPRQRALFDQFLAYYKKRIKEEYDGRDEKWQRDFSGPEAYVASVGPNRERLLKALGGWHWDREDLNLSREVVADFPQAGYRLERANYRIFTGIETDGLLLVPHGEGPFPGVICQVGVNGPPERICGFDGTENIYRRIGARLAAHGYVVLATRMITGFAPDVTRDEDHRAPHLLTETQEEIRQTIMQKYGKDEAKNWHEQSQPRNFIDKHCQLIGHRMMGTEMFALSRGVDLLAQLPEVDAGRIGMYGLSQGGWSALHLPALDTRIRASACSASFNERFRKIVEGTDGFRPSTLYCAWFNIFDKLREFGDAEVASLICPRAFFVEMGVGDDAVNHQTAVDEFNRVKAIYGQLGLGEKCDMVLHDGVHEVEPTENDSPTTAMRFLDKWLKNSDPLATA